MQRRKSEPYKEYTCFTQLGTFSKEPYFLEIASEIATQLTLWFTYIFELRESMDKMTSWAFAKSLWQVRFK